MSALPAYYSAENVTVNITIIDKSFSVTFPKLAVASNSRFPVNRNYIYNIIKDIVRSSITVGNNSFLVRAIKEAIPDATNETLSYYLYKDAAVFSINVNTTDDSIKEVSVDVYLVIQQDTDWSPIREFIESTFDSVVDNILKLKEATDAVKKNNKKNIIYKNEYVCVFEDPFVKGSELSFKLTEYSKNEASYLNSDSDSYKHPTAVAVILTNIVKNLLIKHYRDIWNNADTLEKSIKEFNAGCIMINAIDNAKCISSKSDMIDTKGINLTQEEELITLNNKCANATNKKIIEDLVKYAIEKSA